MGTARLYYQSEKRFRALIENSSDAISLFDTEGNITYTSAASTRVLGLQPHQLVGRNALELIHPDDLETVRHKLEEAKANPNNPAQARARILGNDEQWRWVEGSFTNFFDDPDVRARLPTIATSRSKSHGGPATEAD
jgi:PAS domain S-box-containing protein